MLVCQLRETENDDGTPRPILAKFLYRPERFRVIKKKRDLRDGVRVSDDLIWEDRQKKKQLRSVMKEAFEAGKRPRFHHGKLCKSHLKCLHSFVIIIYLKLFTFKFRQAKTLCK